MSTITDATVIDLSTPHADFIDTWDFICTYPSNVQGYLSLEQWTNLCELFYLDTCDDDEIDFCEWLSGQMKASRISIGEFRKWIDEQSEQYL